MSHNGGRSQVNFWSFGLRSDFAYINLLKHAQAWQAGTTAFPAILNEHGYPQSNPATALNTQFPLPDNDYTGAFILSWQGEGRMQAAYQTTVTEGVSFVVGSTAFNLTVEGVDGRVKFTYATTPAAEAFYMIQSNPLNPLRNVSFIRADQETNFLAGEKFNPDFIQKVTEANFGVLRFLDWMVGNINNTTQWKHQGHVDDWSYDARKWHPDCWAGTASGTDTYSCGAATDTPVSWTHGEVTQVQFTNANTGASTININGRGAKSIIRQYADALPASTITANALATLIYDSQLDKVIYSSDGMTSGVPHGDLIELCNLVGAHGWLTHPFCALDDVITQSATLWKNGLNSGLRVYHEYANEVWNFAFPFTSLAAAKGAVLGYPLGNNERVHGWYAKRYLEIADLIAAVGGSNYRRVITVQAAGDGPQYDTYRFKGADLGVVAPNRPIDKCEAISFASYFQGANVREFTGSYANPLTDLLTAADDYDSGIPASMASALAYIDNDIRAGAKSAVAGDATLAAFEGTIYPRWHAYAVTYGKRLMEYEGALALDTPTTATLTSLGIATAYSAKILALILAYKNSALAKALTLDRYNGFVSLSNAEFPSQYIHAGSYVWGIISDDLYDTPYAARAAIIEFNDVADTAPAPNVPRGSIRTWSYR